MRIIAHVDMDSFFTSCEVLRRPELKGKAIVVGADPKGGKGRGVVSAASYEARKYGIHSGMPISIAYRKCPNCVFLPVDYEYYLKISQKVMEILRRKTNKLEIASIDEAYLDLTYLQSYDRAKEIALEIKREIAQLGLTCSIGIGPNKLISKIASDFQKPDGLTIVRNEQVIEFLKPLEVRVIPGIGPKTSEFLKQNGVSRIADLQAIDRDKLREWFGKFGDEIYNYARGIDDSELITEWEPKCLSREHTFERDTFSIRKIRNTLGTFASELAKEIKEEGKKFRTVTIKIRFSDFETHTASKTSKEPSDSERDIENAAKDLIQKFLPFKKAVRLIGLKISNLTSTEKKVKITEYL
jgi:nucleotidyltransferase/DNA polymerase involved in DNA repair